MNSFSIYNWYHGGIPDKAMAMSYRGKACSLKRTAIIRQWRLQSGLHFYLPCLHLEIISTTWPTNIRSTFAQHPLLSCAQHRPNIRETFRTWRLLILNLNFKLWLFFLILIFFLNFKFKFLNFKRNFNQVKIAYYIFVCKCMYHI